MDTGSSNLPILDGERTCAASYALGSIEKYYDQCWSDYHYFWHDTASYALHFGFWDEDTRSHSESLNNTNRMMAEYAGIKTGDRVLDAGCGVGGTAVWVASRYEASVSCVTVTRSEIARGRRLLKGMRLNESVTFSCQDHSHLAFRSDCFDVVYSIESMCYAPDKAVFLQEAFRVLKPGGRLVVLDGFRTNRLFSSQENSLFQNWLRAWVISDLSTASSLLGFAQATGFRDCLFREITPHVRPSLRRLKRLAGVFRPLSTLLYVLGMRSSNQHANVTAAILQWEAVKLHLWAYGILYGVKGS